MQEKYLRTYPLSTIPTLWPALFYDDSEGTFDYEVSGSGADYSADYTNDTVLVGTNSTKIKSRITAPAEGDIILILKHLPVPPRKLARIQLAFRLGDAATNGNFIVRAIYYSGAGQIWFEIRCLYDDETVYYMNSGGTYTVIPNAFWSKATPVWNYIDLSINLATQKYHLLRINGLSFDLSAHKAWWSSSAVTPKFSVAFSGITSAAAWTQFHIDQILVTPEIP